MSLKKSEYADILNRLDIVRNNMVKQGVRMSLIRRIDDARLAINEIFLEDFMGGKHRDE